MKGFLLSVSTPLLQPCLLTGSHSKPGCPSMQDGVWWRSWEQSPAPDPRSGFGIAGKVQLPHLGFSAVRGWQGPWPPALAKPPPALLPGSLRAPPLVLAAPPHGQVTLLWISWGCSHPPWPGSSCAHHLLPSASTDFQALLHPRTWPVWLPAGVLVGKLLAWRPAAYHTRWWQSSTLAFESMKKKKTPRQVLFVCFPFAAERALRRSCYGLPCAFSLVTVL